MKNTLADLNNYLFEQIERLQDDSLTPEQLETEIRRSETIQKIAGSIIENGSLQFMVLTHIDEYRPGTEVNLPLLGVGSDGS